MIYDCFMIFNELDLLEIRMNILDPYVDYFVITEASETQMGTRKRNYFIENKQRFERFKDKIIYNYIDSSNQGFNSQFERELFQRNSCLDAIIGANDDDMIIFGDLDEIPNPKKLEEVIRNFDAQKIYHFAQRVFYVYMNYENIDGKILSASGDFASAKEKKWLGTRVCSYKKIKEVTCDGLRTPAQINQGSIRIDDGGWHFSWMGGSGESAYKRIKDKCKAFSHNEYNNPKYYNPIRLNYCIYKGRDFLRGGDEAPSFKLVDMDDTYPQWLVDHYLEYPHFWKKRGFFYK